VAPGVELEPRWLAGCSCNFLDRVVRGRADDGACAVGLGRARETPVTFVVREPRESGGCDEDRECELLAAHGDGEVGLRHVDEDLRAQRPAAEGRAVLGDGLLVLGTAVDVVPDDLRQPSLGRSAVLMDIAGRASPQLDGYPSEEVARS